MLHFITAAVGAVLICFTDIHGQEVGPVCGAALSHAVHNHGLAWAKASTQQKHDALQTAVHQIDLAISVRCGNDKDCIEAHRDMATLLFGQILSHSDGLLQKS